MRDYFRGDRRKPTEIFSTGFKRLAWWKSAIKQLSPFVSWNAISFSSEMSGAASFPLDSTCKESYIYIVRDDKGKFFNLYGKSLQDHYIRGKYEADKDILNTLSWANEYVSVDNISPKRIIGALRIQRKFNADEIIQNPSQLASFQILEYVSNPEIKDHLTTPEKLLVKKIRQHISEKTEISSGIGRKAQQPSLAASSSLFSKIREDKMESALGHLSTTDVEMIYAATKAKFIGKSKICGEKMRKFLQTICLQTQPAVVGYPGVFSTRSTIEGLSIQWEQVSTRLLINSFFTTNRIFDQKSIPAMPQHEIEKLFFSFQDFWKDNDLSKFFGEDLDIQRQAIITEHAEILENNSPQAKFPEDKSDENSVSRGLTAG